MGEQGAKRVRCGGCVALVLAVLAVGIPGSAPAGAADPATPPGWQNPPDGWVAFTLDDPSPDPVGRSGVYSPVTLERHGDLSGTALRDAFDNWATTDSDGDGNPDQWGWPSTWSAGGVQLARVDWCDYTATSCAYTVEGGGGERVYFFGGTVPIDPTTGAPEFDPAALYDQGELYLAPAPALHLSVDWAGVVGIPDPSGGPGRIRLDASATSDDLGGTLTFEWVVKRLSDARIYTGSGAIFEPLLDEDGSYCVELTVTAADGYSESTPSCATGGGAVFAISGVAPRQPASTPGESGGGAPAAPGVVFANPVSRAPAALTGGITSSPTVVWLWRPDWYQGDEQAQGLPETGGEPDVRGRQEIVISRRGRAVESAAGPWLAGLGAFGLIGLGWLVSRRRRVRAAL